MSKKCFDTIGWYVNRTLAYFMYYLSLIKTDDINDKIVRMLNIYIYKDHTNIDFCKSFEV